jgi:hypothetical protein
MLQSGAMRVNRPIEEDLRWRLVRLDEASRPAEGRQLCQPYASAGRIDRIGRSA